MMKNREIASALFWLVIGLGLSIWTVTSYEIGHLTQPGTGYLPLALGIIMVILSLILLVGQLKQTPGASGPAVPPAGSPGGWKRVAYTVVVLMVGAFFFEQVGYLLTFFLLIVLLMKAGERQSWTRIILTALLTTACVYVVFVRLLEVQLPRGFLGV
jgi:putative tricarboxylic transport membrane protein